MNKGVFDRIQVGEWNHEIGEYIDRNDYLTAANKKKDLDKYFAPTNSLFQSLFDAVSYLYLEEDHTLILPS